MPRSSETRERRFADFKDRLGRVIGARAYCGQLTEADRNPNGDGWTRMLEAGTPFWYEPQATRDGNKYGALQGYYWFATAEDRDDAVVKYFDGAYKRAFKKASTK